MNSLTELFCRIDDFCQTFEPEWERHLLAAGHKQRRRAASLGLSELITLAVLFHQLRYRHFKSFYLFDEGFANLQVEWYEPVNLRLPDRIVTFVYWEDADTVPEYSQVKAWGNEVARSHRD